MASSTNGSSRKTVIVTQAAVPKEEDIVERKKERKTERRMSDSTANWETLKCFVLCRLPEGNPEDKQSMIAPLPFPASAQSISRARPIITHSMKQTKEFIKAGRALHDYIVDERANNGSMSK
jgi:hypothetical protein